MLLRSSYQHVKPGFDFRRWLMALKKRWYLFFICTFLTVGACYYLNSKTPNRYKLKATYFVLKDEEPGFTGTEQRIPLLRLFAEQSSIENDIGLLKSNQMLYQCLLELKRHINYRKTPHQTIKQGLSVSFMSEIMPTDLSMKITHLEDDSCEVVIKGGEKQLMHLRSGYTDGFAFLKDQKFRMAYDQSWTTPLMSFVVQKNDSIPIGYSQRIQTVNLQKLMGEYDQRIRIKTLNKRATILTIGLSTTEPQIDSELLNLLMEKTIKKRKDEEEELAHITIDALNDQLNEGLQVLEKLSLEKMHVKMAENFTELRLGVQSVLLRLNELEESKEKMNAEITAIKSAINNFQSKELSNYSSSTFGYDFQLVNAIKEFHLMRIELASEEVLKRPKNPKLIRLKKQLKHQGNTIKELLESRKRHLEYLISELDKEQIELNKKLDRHPYLARGLSEINREIGYRNREAKKLKRKISEIRMAMSYKVSTTRILDEASPTSKPFGPLTAEGFVISFFISLFLPVIVVFIDSLRGSRIYSETQIEQLLQDKPLVKLNRFNFKRNKPFAFAVNNEKRNQEFLLFTRELLFEIHQHVAAEKGVVVGFHSLFPQKSGIRLAHNLTKSINSFKYTALQISIANKSGFNKEVSLEHMRTSIENSRTLCLNQSWLDHDAALPTVLEELRNDFDYINISLPENILSDKRTEFSKLMSINLGLVKDHSSREHNVSIFQEVLQRISDVPVKTIYLCEAHSKIQFFKPLKSHYELKLNRIEKLGRQLLTILSKPKTI